METAVVLVVFGIWLLACVLALVNCFFIAFLSTSPGFKLAHGGFLAVYVICTLNAYFSWFGFSDGFLIGTIIAFPFLATGHFVVLNQTRKRLKLKRAAPVEAKTPPAGGV